VAREVRSEGALGELIELAPDAVVLGSAERRVVGVNGAACKLYGYDRGELVGMMLEELLGPEERARAEEIRPVPGLVHLGEWHARRKDGTLVPVEAHGTVLPDGRSATFIRDITERKRAERERDESLRWLRAVLDQSPVGLFLAHGTPCDRVELNAHGQQMTQRRPEHLRDVLGNVRRLDGEPMTVEDLPIVRALRGERVSGEFLLRDGAGGLTPIAISAAPIAGPDGKVLGAVSAFEDIRVAKELERLRAEWSSVVAHDLRQPLSSISLNAAVLVRATEDPRVLKCAERIVTAAKRLNRMVGDLMDLSRLEARRLELARQRVDVAALVQAALERIELQLPDRALALRLEAGLPEVDADPDRIAQVMDNLLTNAVKYGDPRSAIAVSVSREGGVVAVAVTSQGRPLTADELARLFERFQRADASKRAGIPGVGLGLYITRSLIEAHGGRIDAASTPAGVTTFRFTLPITDG